MKKGIVVILAVLMLSTLAFSATTITDVNTNGNVPLGQLLTISGTYTDTTTEASVFCKFVTMDAGTGLVIERLSDERTFANGDFYSQRLIDEPRYKRETDYNVSISCSNASADANFSVVQREDITHTVQQEWSYAFDQNNIETFFFLGVLILVIIFLVGAGVFWYKNARNTYRG